MVRFKGRSVFSSLIVGLLVWLSVLSQASAVILERNTMVDVAPLIEAQTLVVFDIDNTLIEPTQTLGSDQWFRYVLNAYLNKGLPQDTALAKILGYWKTINEVTHVHPVERETPHLVDELQKAGIKVIVLTARSTDLTQLTERQLYESKLDFSRSTISKNSDIMIDQGLRYAHGILFSSGQNKGLSLLKFFRHFQLTPTKVVFIDDQIKNVQAMEAALTQAHINSFNIRYGALDAKVKAFNPKVPLVEWGVFNKYHRLISDKDALRIIEGR